MSVILFAILFWLVAAAQLISLVPLGFAGGPIYILVHVGIVWNVCH
jgi:hypothetical protein